MGLWADLESDVAAIVERDGEQVKITTDTQTCYVTAFVTKEASSEGGMISTATALLLANTAATQSGVADGATVTIDNVDYVAQYVDRDQYGQANVTLALA